jgi:poly(A) polymerase
MAQAGVLAQILPGADPDPLARLVHLAPERHDPILRLAALGGEAAPERLRLSRAETRRLEVLRGAATGSAGPGELAWRHGADAARAAIALRAALFETPLPKDAEPDIAAGAGASFPVTAADLMPQWKGPALGARLKELERAWIASGFAADKATLLALPPRDEP